MDPGLRMLYYTLSNIDWRDHVVKINKICDMQASNFTIYSMCNFLQMAKV